VIEPAPVAGAEPQLPNQEAESANLLVRYGSPLPAAPTDTLAEHASARVAPSPTKDLPEAEARNADRPIGSGEGGNGPADYVVFASAAAPDPRTAPTGAVADSLCRIIGVEGPMLAKRAYDVYLRGCGIRRLGGELRTALNRALAQAIKDGRVISENGPGVTGLIYSTVRLQNTASVTLRFRGSRTFEEIPPGELYVAAKHVFQADHMMWSSDEHLRAVLEFFDLKRLTTQVGIRLKEILNRPDCAID
jgi:hypothetical protein